jgi:DNA invertase Pin-like site-specific DNA recombinase
MVKLKEYKVGIYARLSKEDTRNGESISIENQKLMLMKHVKEMGWELREVYQDDGFSGTNQNRPALKKMLADVESGYINTVVIKDLSRLGRNYLEVGNLAEVFLPEHNCELISLGEKLDDMMVFRNWFNEQHSKSTSSKVRAVKKICAENGKYMGAYAPYGYRKSDENKHKLIPDETAAEIVRKIFEMRASGTGFRAIATRLNADCIIPPLEYFYQSRERKNPCKTNRLWSATTVQEITENEVYIGNLVQGKSTTISFKNPKQITKNRDEWIRIEEAHEPIIERELWDKVQAFNFRKYKPRRRKDGEMNLFAGLLYCADCGFKLRGCVQHRKRTRTKRISYMCGTYAHSGKNACSIHSINEAVLIDIVTAQIRTHAKAIKLDEQCIIEAIINAQNSENSAYQSTYKSELETHKKAIEKLDLLIENLYADKVSGIVSVEMFKRQVMKHEQDRAARQKAVNTLEQRIKNANVCTENAADWAEKIKQFTSLDTLTPEILFALIDKIIIGEKQIINNQRVCDVRIIYNFVGEVSVNV